MRLIGIRASKGLGNVLVQYEVDRGGMYTLLGYGSSMNAAK